MLRVSATLPINAGETGRFPVVRWMGGAYHRGMTNQSAIFVDAGFLHSVGAQRVAATSYRDAVKVQYSTLVQGITNAARAHSGVPNLRTYWYDASRDGLLTDEHKRIAMIPGVKVRLGRLNYFGEQKGVDLRLALDLVGLARTGAASVAYLISGDDDLTEAVEEAQSLGIRVVLLGIAEVESRIGVSAVAENLAYTVDGIELLSEDLLKAAFTRSLSKDPVSASAAAAVAAAAGSAKSAGSAGSVGVGGSGTAVGGEAGSGSGGITGVAGTGRVPSPAALARQTTEPKVAVRPEAAVVYSSSTGGVSSPDRAGGYNQKSLTGHELSLIATAEEIGAKVAANWYASTTQTELADVFGDRPQIPAMIDRILIKDCAREIGEHDTYLQSIRQALRRAFWDKIDELH